MIMRFRPANISLINRRLYLPRLLLTLSSIKKNDQRILTGHYISTSGLATIWKLRWKTAVGECIIADALTSIITAPRD
jgi:hypothetical protein